MHKNNIAKRKSFKHSSFFGWLGLSEIFAPMRFSILVLSLKLYCLATFS